MKIKKVAIVGGGMSGLVCAYYLNKAGIKSKIFEKKNLIGGRALYSGGLVLKFEDTFRGLMKEFGLKEIEMSLKSAGIWTDHGFIPVDRLFSFSYMIKSFSLGGFLQLMKIRKLLKDIPLETVGLNPTQEKLRAMSYEDFLKENCSAEKLRPFLELPSYMFFYPDISKLPADYGLSWLKLFLNITTEKKPVSRIAGGHISLAKEIKDVLVKQGCEVLASAEVESIDELTKGYKVTYKLFGETKSEEFEVLVLTATPGAVSKMVKFDLKLGVEEKEYSTISKVISVVGDLKQDVFVILGQRGNRANLLWLHSPCPFTSPRQYHLFPWDPKKDIAFDEFFKSYEIIGEEGAMPLKYIAKVGETLPPLKTKKENLYLAGGYNYYQYSVEAAAATGKKVAGMIIGKAE